MIEKIDYETLEKWAEEVEMAWTLTKRGPWRVGDLVMQGIDSFTDGSKEEVEELLDLLSEQLEVSKKTLTNYARVAREYHPDDRWSQLELSHHEALIRFSLAERQKWLQKAAESGWSVARLRVEVSAGSDDPDEPVPLPNRVAVERAFYRAGVQASIAKGHARFRLPSGTLVLTTEGELTWGVET